MPVDGAPLPDGVLPFEPEISLAGSGPLPDGVLPFTPAEPPAPPEQGAAYRATAAGMPPGHAAEAKRYADASGLAPDWVSQNLQIVKSEVDHQDLVRQLAGAPLTAGYMTDPVRASLVKDDVAQLHGIEWTLTGGDVHGRYAPPFWAAALADGVREAEIAFRQTAQYGRAFVGAAEDPESAARIRELQAKVEASHGYGIDDVGFTPARVLARAIADAVKMVPLIGGTVATAAAGGAVAGPVGAVAAPLAFNFGMSAGPEYAAKRSELEAQGKAGDATAEHEALFWATLGGAANAAIMTAGSGPIVKGIGAKLGLGKLIAGGEAAVAKLVQEETVGRVLRRGALEYGAHWAEGVATMVAMGAVSAATQEAFRSDLAGDELHLNRVGDAMIEAGKSAAGTMALLSAVSFPVRQYLAEVGRARAIGVSADRLAAAAEAARASKTVERAPGEAADLIGQFAHAGNADTVFIEKGEFDRLYQGMKDERGQPLNPRDVAARFLGDDGKAWDQANATGADLPVPTATFLTQMARSSEGLKLQDIARLDGEQTPRQARENAAAVGKRIKEQAEAAQKAGLLIPADRIREDFKARAIAAGRSELEAATTAEIVSRAYTWFGAETQQDPFALYQRESPKLVGPDPATTAALVAAAAARVAERGAARAGRVVTPQRPGGEPVRYRLVEADKLVASHTPDTFTPNADYPAGVQERQYHSQPEEQAKVIQGAQRLDPALVLSDTPSAVDGPPLVTAGDKALVLGGNGRSMMIARAFKDPAALEKYKAALAAKAERFGLSPAQVKKMKAPVLVREVGEVRSDAPAQDLVAAVRRFNEGMTQVLSPKARAVAEAKTMTPATVAAIGNLLGDGEASLREVMDARPGDFLAILERDGVVNAQNRAAWAAGGRLTDEAKDRIEGMFLGRVVGSADRLAAAAPAIVRKLERIAPELVRVEGVNPAASEIPAVQAALDVLADAARRKMTIEDLTKQASLPGDAGVAGVPADVAALATLIDTAGPKKLAERFHAWADAAAVDPRQATMFGAPPTPEQARQVLLEGGGDAARAAQGQLAQLPEGATVTVKPGKERGYFQVELDAGGDPVRAEIHLTNPDRSTLAHELMHSFVEVLGRLAQKPEASQGLRDSYQALLRAMGFADHRERMVAAKERRELGAEIQRARQAGEHGSPQDLARLKDLTAREERVSHMWEQFLAEGKAPARDLLLLPVFARFKMWLGRIYRGVEGIQSQFRAQYGEDLQLNEEVRNVFRRMLAGDEAVADAARQLDAERPAVKLSPKEQEEASRLEAEQRARAEAEVQRLIAKEERSADSEHMRAERERFRAEVDAEVGQERTYRTIDALSKGDVKLDRGEIVRDHGVAVADALPKDVLGKDGLPPDAVANLFGFDSGADLVRALAGAEPRKSRVAREAAQRLRDRYPALTDRPRLLAAVAKEELHNAAFLREGIIRLRAMARELGLEVEVPTAQQLADAAEGMVRDTKYSAIRPDAFDLAARGAARRASEATDPKVRKAEFETYLLNRALYRAALDARVGAEKNARALAELARPSAARRRIEKATQRTVLPDGTVQFTNPHLAMIDELLGAFEFRASASLREVRAREAQRAALEQWVAERRADGESVVVPDSVMKSLERTTHWKDLTPAELEDLRTAVDSIAAQAELRTAYKVGEQKMAHEAVVAELVDGATANGRGITDGLGSNVATVGERLAAAGRSLQYMLERPELLFRALDGHKDDGPWQRLVWRKLSGASYRFYDLQREAGAKILEVLDAIPAAERRELKRRDFVVDGNRYSGENIIAVLANAGNESNFGKMLKGMSDPRLRQFGEVPWNGRATFDALVAHATPRHVEIVNAIHKALETHWDKAVELERTDSGVPPKKVPTRPFTFLGKDGQQLTIDGGYYPVLYSRKFRIGKEQAGADTAGLLGMPGLFNRDYDAATTPQGYLQERIESYARPLDLSLEALPGKLVMQAKDIAFRLDAKQLYRVLTDDRIIGALHQAVGEEGYNVILSHLKESVNDVMLPDAGAGFAHEIIRKARGLVSQAIFGLNVQQTLQNLADVTGVGAVVPQRYWAAAAIRVAKDIPGELAFMRAKSGEMRLRGDGHSSSVARALEHSFRTSELAMKWDHAKEIFMIPFETTNAMVEVPVWRGAYDHALEQGKSEVAAIEHADSAVRTLFGGKRTVDLPPISRDKVFRHLTMFYGWANSQLNLFMRAAGEAGVQWGEGARLKALKTVGGAFALLFAKQIASELFSGRAPEDSNKDGELDVEDVGKWLAWRGLMASPLGNTPVLGPGLKALESGAQGRDVSLTPWLQLANATVRAGQATAKAATSEGELTDEQLTNLFLAWLEAGGQATGAPAVQIGATARYWLKARTGDESAAEDVLGTAFGPKRPGKLSQALFGGQ
jgi:hypothetical protein